MSQSIPIDSANVMHTLENLWKLLTFKEYPSRLVQFRLIQTKRNTIRAQNIIKFG